MIHFANTQCMESFVNAMSQLLRHHKKAEGLAIQPALSFDILMPGVTVEIIHERAVFPSDDRVGGSMTDEDMKEIAETLATGS